MGLRVSVNSLIGCTAYWWLSCSQIVSVTELHYPRSQILERCQNSGGFGLFRFVEDVIASLTNQFQSLRDPADIFLIILYQLKSLKHCIVEWQQAFYDFLGVGLSVLKILWTNFKLLQTWVLISGLKCFDVFVNNSYLQKKLGTLKLPAHYF